MRGLSRETQECLFAAARAIRDRHMARAETLLRDALAKAPEHPEALRLLGILRTSSGNAADAIVVFQRALARSPDDAMILTDLGNAQVAAGRYDEAFATWRRAAAIAPTHPMPWFNLGRNLQLRGETTAAVDALLRASELAPDLLPAWILLGDANAHLGDFDRAAGHYRRALALHPSCGDAWRGLANIKTRPLDDIDRRTLQAALARHDVADADRVAMGYALGKLLEDQGEYEAAFRTLSEANRRLRGLAPWNAGNFHTFVTQVVVASAKLPAPLDPGLGTEVIFVVGLPRSGSTLVEQILAAHPSVEGASELPDLGDILAEESSRRGQPFPSWVAAANADDWHRLGTEYLRRTQRWRQQRPRFTDKMPENWLYVGVLRAMLPSATIIDVRRDPLEVGWSCFKQPFYRLPHFSCDLGDIGAYWRDCTQTLDHWRESGWSRIRRQSYEALVADPENEIRALVDSCGLSFDPACLAFHEAKRSVRTPSASQVRQRLRADTARAAHYGAMLAPLVAALLG